MLSFGCVSVGNVLKKLAIILFSKKPNLILTLYSLKTDFTIENSIKYQKLN